jgi:predicted nuclease with TOPRIM domain
MADMERFARTIESLEEDLARLDENLRQQESKKTMMNAAISESVLQQEAHQTEIDELIKEIADLECQAEDAACLKDACTEPPAKSVQVQVHILAPCYLVTALFLSSFVMHWSGFLQPLVLEHSMLHFGTKPCAFKEERI